MLNINTIQMVVTEGTGVQTFTVRNEPMHDPDLISLRKVDSVTGRPIPQGNATFAGARYTIEFRYVAGGPIIRTWIFEVRYMGGWYGFNMANPAHRVGGDPLWMDSGFPVFPIGHYTIRESTAPTGYILDPTNWTATVSSVRDGGINTIRFQTINWPAGSTVNRQLRHPEVAITDGRVSIEKFCVHTGSMRHGDATTIGTVYRLVNRSTNYVVINGQILEVGQHIDFPTQLVGGRSLAELTGLPFGTYEIFEVQPATGFLLDGPPFRHTFTVNATNHTHNFHTSNASRNYIQRGSIVVPKIDRERATNVSQGDGTLQGAVIEVINRSTASKRKW